MEALFTANCLFVDENYVDAVVHYKNALEANPELFVAQSNLAATYLKLGLFAEALEASLKAISINPESSFGYLRAGLSHFYREEFQVALTYFEQAEAKVPGSAEKWIAKSRAELGKTQIIPEPYSWYQSDDTIYLDARVKAVGTPLVELQPSRLSVKAVSSSGAEYNLSLNLANAIDTATSSYQVLPNKIEFRLKKAVAGNWLDLEPTQLTEGGRPSYPTSSKKKTDWDKLDKEAEVEIKKEKPQGEAALQELFKEIYSNADEDTRRAMIKSFQTSGGTVLSTNWGEVKEKDYEGQDRPSAPDGQQWAK
mmetsp:Transcript_16441/g.29674  ORF Transcript_16441/g.29674 Transcript_16441/m.29674 type:complete len:309 (-) Transcript_16441:716-1642(-)